MTGQQLKNSILQWAIQGKLVPQIASEGTAEDLLKEIRAEKERLVKEGKLKKKDLEVKPIEDDEIPFEIPEGWRWCRLGEIITLLSGQDLTPDRYFDTPKGIPYITGASHFISGELIISRWTESPTSISHIGDLLITCKGTVGTMAYNKIGEVHIARQIMAINGYKTYLPYIQHFLEIEVPELEKKAHSIIPGISREVVLNTVIPLPPLAEQKRIVSKIEELMPLVEQYGKAQEQLEALNYELPEKLKKSVLQEAIMGKLVPQDPKEGTADELIKTIKKKQQILISEKKIKVGKYNKDIKETELPQGWTSVKLGNICSLITKQTGFDYSKSIKPNLIDTHIKGSIPMIQTKNFKGKTFDFDTDYYIPMSVAEKFPNIMLDRKCMLLSIVGASVGNVGIFDDDRIGIIGGAICKVVLLDERLYDYIYYFLKSPQGHDEIYKNFKSTAQGTIMVQDVREIQIPLPPLAEQKRIVAKVEEVMGEIEGMKR